tara:strand:+ start:267 stop:560 length:294 start_codon:yes stop_codon:yes gene_type:complete
LGFILNKMRAKFGEITMWQNIIKSNLEEWRKADSVQERLEWLEKVGKLEDEEILIRLFDAMFDYNSPHSKGLAGFMLSAGVDPQTLLETAKKNARDD